MVAVFFLTSELIAHTMAQYYKENAYNLYNFIMDASFYKSTIIPAASDSANVSITMQLQLLSIVRVSIVIFPIIKYIFISCASAYQLFSLSLSPLNILQVSEKEQTLMTNTRLFMTWHDAYLSWDPVRYGNITSLLLAQDSVWLPDITVANTVEPSAQIG